MPQEPLIDSATFDALDVSKPYATREDLEQYLRQRGTFFLLDGILRYTEEDDLVIGYKEIRGDDWWAADHIPGRPLFPGALMIEAGAQVCSYDFSHRHGRGEFVGFGGVNDCRFRGTVEPDCRMIFGARARRIRKRLFTYGVQGFVERKLVFEAEILGIVL